MCYQHSNTSPDISLTPSATALDVLLGFFFLSCFPTHHRVINSVVSLTHVYVLASTCLSGGHVWLSAGVSLGPSRCLRSQVTVKACWKKAAGWELFIAGILVVFFLFVHDVFIEIRIWCFTENLSSQVEFWWEIQDFLWNFLFSYFQMTVFLFWISLFIFIFIQPFFFPMKDVSLSKTLEGVTFLIPKKCLCSFLGIFSEQYQAVSGLHINSFSRKNQSFKKYLVLFQRSSKESHATFSEAHSLLSERALNEATEQPFMQSQHLCLAHIQYEVTGKITCCKDEWQYLHLLIPLSILSEHITAVCTGVKTDFWCCIGLVLYSGIKLVFILISHPQCLSLKVLNNSFGKKKTKYYHR